MPTISAAVLGSLALLVPVALADDLYFAEIQPGFGDGFVSRVKPDGSGYSQLFSVGSGIRAVAVDSAGGKVYWTDVNNSVIARSDLDGGNAENVIVSGLVFPSAIVLDHELGAMYWLDQDTWMARAGFDGSGFEVLSDTVTHRGIDIDHVHGKVYWSTSDTRFVGRILRSDLDGSHVQIVVRGGMEEFKPNAIALDVAGGKIYWTDYVIDVVSRSNLDGTGVEILWAAGANHNPRGIALDLAHGKLYWGQDNDFDATSGRIMRMDLDGSNPEVVLDQIGLPNYLAFVPGPDGPPTCPADFNGDGFLDFFDYDDYVLCYETGQCPDGRTADFNGDQFADFFDYDDFVTAFEAGC